jgi:tetratricopeptide (TPR) repeat protein
MHCAAFTYRFCVCFSRPARRLVALVLPLVLAALLLAPSSHAQDLLQQAEKAYDASQYETAISLVDSMVVLDTLDINDDVPTALRVEAKAHKAQGDWEKAVETLDEALARDPFFSSAYIMKARILNERGRTVEAMAAAEEAARLEPQSRDVQMLFANIQFKTNSYGAAIDSYSDILSLDPSHAEAYIMRGRSLLKLDRLEKAYFDAVDAIKLVPDRPEPYQIKAEAEFRARQFQNAANSYATLAEKLEAADGSDRSIATAYSNRGQALLNMNQLDAALKSLNRAVEVDPSLAVAYRARGMVYGKKESRGRACSDFQKALELGLDAEFEGEVEEIVGSYCAQL